MATKLYTIESLLVGKNYRSNTRHFSGEIISAEHGQSWSRYSFIGVSSSATLRSKSGKALWSGKPPKGVLLEGEIWDVFKQTLDFLATKPFPNLPPLTGGLVGYMAYDIVRLFEKIPANNPDETNVPDLVMLLATDFAVLDHVDGSVWLIANAVNYDGTDDRVEIAYQDAVTRLDAMQDSLNAPQSQVEFIGVEAGGPKNSKLHAAPLTNKSKIGILHGAAQYVVQDREGQISDSYFTLNYLNYAHKSHYNRRRKISQK